MRLRAVRLSLVVGMIAPCSFGLEVGVHAPPAAIEGRISPIVPAAIVDAPLTVVNIEAGPLAEPASPAAVDLPKSVVDDRAAEPTSAGNAAASASPEAPSEPAQFGESASVEASQRWDGGGRRRASDDALSLADSLISGRASPEFVSALRDHVTRTFPPAVLHALLSAGYRVEANAHVTQGRPEMDEEDNTISGYSADGPDDRLIIIGEMVRQSPDKKWEKSSIWENAVSYEFGLAINRVLGGAATESPEFRGAWHRDVDAMPSELRRAEDPDGVRNDFYYFLSPGKDGSYREARERTFAEGLDILLRGPRSAYNYDDFALFFPHALADIRREMEARFGWRIPEPAPASKPRGPWENPNAAPGELAQMLVSGAASPEFVEKVRALVARTFPAETIRDLLAAGYRVDANVSVRQGREHLDKDNDTRGGFHNHGTGNNYIVVAEKFWRTDSKKWVDSALWENAVIHEIGHALAYIHGETEAKLVAASDPRLARWYRMKGLSESPAFREAWRLDFNAMPAKLKRAWPRKKYANAFFYYTHPDAGGQRARQETYAEGLDVLLRGRRSSKNYARFKRHFPRALAEIRRELGNRYPELFPAERP